MAIVEKLEQQLDIPEAVRIHWTGCPNSCGQVKPFTNWQNLIWQLDIWMHARMACLQRGIKQKISHSKYSPGESGPHLCITRRDQVSPLLLDGKQARQPVFHV